MQIGTRIRVQQSGDSLRIVIGPERRVASAFLTLTVFGFPLFAICGALLISPPTRSAETAIIGVFMILAAAMLLWGLFDVSFRLFGWEELALDEQTLTMLIRIFGYRKTKSYARAAIKDLRYEERLTSRRGAGYYRRAITFEYEGQKVSTFRQITREEGERLIKGPLNELTSSAST
jgi:hypothetical protein